MVPLVSIFEQILFCKFVPKQVFITNFFVKYCCYLQNRYKNAVTPNIQNNGMRGDTFGNMIHPTVECTICHRLTNRIFLRFHVSKKLSAYYMKPVVLSNYQKLLAN